LNLLAKNFKGGTEEDGDFEESKDLVGVKLPFDMVFEGLRVTELEKLVESVEDGVTAPLKVMDGLPLLEIVIDGV